MSNTQTYSGRGSVHRAAKKALGTAYRVERLPDGRYAYHPADALPAPRVKPQTAPAIDDDPPGLKRLRRSPKAESIRKATLADQITGRAEAAARIAGARAAVDLPAFLPGRGAARAPAAARQARAAPREGTKARIIFDLLCRPEGATAKEIAAAGVPGASVKVYATDFAKAYAMEAACEKEGPVDRCRLAKA